MRESLADAVAATAVGKIADLIAAARRLDSPAQAETTRALAVRSRTVRAWARCSAASSMLIPLGIAVLASKFRDVATEMVSGWTIAALAGGAIALTVTSIDSWRANYDAI